MELPPKETIWRRGWRDAKAGWGDWRFLLFEAIMAPGLGSLSGWQLGSGVGTITGLLIVVLGVMAVWAGSTLRAPIHQRNEYFLMLKATLQGQGKTGTISQLFVIQKLEDQVKSGFMILVGGGKRGIRDDAEAKEAKAHGHLSYHAELHLSAIPTRLVERVDLEVAGETIPAEGWESRIYEGFDRVFVEFSLPSTIPSGDHPIRFIAYSDSEQTPSEAYLTHFP